MYNRYGYSYSYRSPSVDIGAILLILGILVFAGLIIGAWCKLFSKAGLPWERVFVPFYGSYWTYEIADCGAYFWYNILLGIAFSLLSSLFRVYWAIMSILSLIFFVVSLVLRFLYCKKLAESFGKGIGFAIGLMLLNPIFIMILGYGSAEYGHASYSDITVTSSWQCSCGTYNPSHKGFCENCGAAKK